MAISIYPQQRFQARNSRAVTAFINSRYAKKSMLQQSFIQLLPVLALGIMLPNAAQSAELQSPQLGMTMTWDCSGAFTRRYQVKVTDLDDGMVTYQGLRDDEEYWVEKAAGLTGTTLWVKKSGNRYQWFDKEDFERYAKMVPGSKFKGAVPARDGEDKWVWDYTISIDSPQRMQHPVVGDVTVIPVKEKRHIYHGDYWSQMTSFVIPEKGLTLRWIFEDPRGIEDCDISAIQKNGKLSKLKADKK